MKSFHKSLLSLSAILLFSLQSFSQESSCTNGVDDDGDGFIDCYDSDCAGEGSCSTFFIGNAIVCKDEPTGSFSMQLQWGSPDKSANSHATPAIGDIDSDGTPEVVVTNRQERTLAILDGVTGA
ncbi:MAG: hypothetical protein OEY56_12190, partial [Cyclobacteriaceae bacterium]|nr:hypothetical protein [Cyclobacteriaceae bacterium]